MVGGDGGDRREVELDDRRPLDGQQDLGRDVVAQGVGAMGQLAEISLVDPPGQAFPRRTVGHRGERHHAIARPGAVGLVEVPEEPGVVALAEPLHPAIRVAERRLERVLGVPDHSVDLVEVERHRPAPGAAAEEMGGTGTVLLPMRASGSTDGPTPAAHSS